MLPALYSMTIAQVCSSAYPLRQLHCPGVIRSITALEIDRTCRSQDQFLEPTSQSCGGFAGLFRLSMTSDWCGQAGPLELTATPSAEVSKSYQARTPPFSGVTASL
ncbi:hypothetical protein BGZ57DRAFT_885557 [Hyaloscypha finlandica]|nr:hypothetical protein BGZ57DRAFT_885557 [Hyaloscypha finlandica]